MARTLGVVDRERAVTLEDVMHLLAALLHHGYGRCEIQIVGHHFDTVRVTPVLKGGEDVTQFAEMLTKTIPAY
jgi:hypothetical protein